MMLMRCILQKDGTVKETLIEECKCDKREGILVCTNCGGAIPDWGKTPDHSKEKRVYLS